MERLKYLLLSLLIVACSGKKDVIPDKSIFEPLTVEELSTIIKQDTLFVDFYESIQEEVEDYTDIEKAKFNDVTYRGLYRAYESLIDHEEYGQFTLPFWDEWGKTYEADIEKADSLILFWERYRAEHNFQEYVSAEAVDLVTESTYGIKSVYMVVRVTPLVEDIKNVNIKYTCRFKGERDQTLISYYPTTSDGYLWIYDLDCVREERKTLDLASSNYLKDRSFEDFLKDFDIDFRVTSITIGDDLYMEDESVYPEGVLKVLEQGPFIPGSIGGYKGDVIKANINPNYVEVWQYIDNRVEEYMEKHHPRESAFMKYAENRSKRR